MFKNTLAHHNTQHPPEILRTPWQPHYVSIQINVSLHPCRPHSSNYQNNCAHLVKSMQVAKTRD